VADGRVRRNEFASRLATAEDMADILTLPTADTSGQNSAPDGKINAGSG